jgi:biopolymer transport protein ExbB
MIHLIENAVSNGQWEEAESICRRPGDKPLARILLAGLGARSMGREEMENALQEAILSEIPAMERFLSALGMLAAIAPLLGLLGTVTGMINTFHVITLHGTGDPRLMSGGISEALVTTMLGLSAAIPLLMAHNLLGNVVDKSIADMEEKSVALVNVILKARESGGKY